MGITFITFLYGIENQNKTAVAFAARTNFGTGDLSNYSREQTYPDKGASQLYHQMTGAPLKYENIPGINIFPQLATFYKYPAICQHNYYGVNQDPLVFTLIPCSMKRKDNYICVFQIEPTFRVRGLCKNAVMDTQYKLADHAPGSVKYGRQNLRDFVGPKGWIISRNNEEKRWKMTHYHYTDLTLTMLEQDSLPVGTHRWRVQNDVCNEGETSTRLILISGCQEDQFTCDDGKCLKISQRCNNIEVREGVNRSRRIGSTFSRP